MNRRPISLALVTLLTASALAAAQTAPPKTIDLNLTATSVADYAAYLRNELGENIVVVPERGLDPAKVILPPITVKQLNPQDAIDLLKLAPDCAVAISTTQAQATGRPVTIVNISRRGGDDAPEPERMNVFPLEKLLLGDSPKDRIPDDAEREKALSDRAEQLLVLAEQTFAMVSPSGEKPELRYHAPTHTLLVKATETDAERVKKLIEALRVPLPPMMLDARAAEGLRSALRDAESEKADMKQRLERLDTRLTTAIVQRDQLARQFADTVAAREGVSRVAPASQPAAAN